MKIDSDDISLSALLAGNFFRIPRFQRPYSWDEDNIKELWDDIDTNASEEYFIGSIVTYKEEESTYNIVDGQQRITTIMLLLSAIRDNFLSLGNKDLAEGLDQLISRNDIRTNKKKYILRTETSYPFLQENILKFEKSDIDLKPKPEEENLEIAFKTINEKIAEMLNGVTDENLNETGINNEKIHLLESLRDKIFNVKVIFIRLENEEDAYLIFETLNTRGKDLATTDLAKNHISRILQSDTEVDSTSIKWSRMLTNLNESHHDLNPDDFLYYFWNSRRPATTQKKLYVLIKGEVSPQNAAEFLNDLVMDSEYFVKLSNPKTHWNKNEIKISESLQALNIFKVTQPTAALLSIIRAYENKKIKLRVAVRALQSIENFHFLFTAVSSKRSSGGISGMYNKFAKELHESADSNQASIIITDFIEKKLKSKIPSYVEFEAKFAEIIFTNKNSKQRPLVEYILRKYSQHMDFSFTDDYSQLTIEHFHPQSKITDEWNEEIVGGMGNLCLMDAKINREMDNLDTLEKRGKLISIGYSVPQSFIDWTPWSPEHARNNLKVIAKLSYEEIWNI